MSHQRFDFDPEVMQQEFYDSKGRKLETFYCGCRRSAINMSDIAAWLAINDGQLSEETKVTAYKCVKLSRYESAWAINRSREFLEEMARGEEPYDVMIFKRWTPKKYRADLPQPWIDYRHEKEEAFRLYMAQWRIDPWGQFGIGEREHRKRLTELRKAWSAIKKPSAGNERLPGDSGCHPGS